MRISFIPSYARLAEGQRGMQRDVIAKIFSNPTNLTEILSNFTLLPTIRTFIETNFEGVRDIQLSDIVFASATAEIPGNIIDKATASSFLKLLAGLTLSPEIMRISFGSESTFQNFEARGQVQSGAFAGPTPYSVAGLDGAEQIISVGDSGIDDLHCQFFDDSNAYKSNMVTRNGTGYGTVEPLRRKVIQYFIGPKSFTKGGDTIDDGEGGHGTHVAGSAAGNCLDKSTAANSNSDGMAPAAKLILYDCGSPGGGADCT